MKSFLHTICLLFFGLLSLGTGLCSAAFSPSIFTAPDFLIFWLPSVAIAVGSFFAARYFYRRLTAKPTEE